MRPAATLPIPAPGELLRLPATRIPHDGPNLYSDGVLQAKKQHRRTSQRKMHLFFFFPILHKTKFPIDCILVRETSLGSTAPLGFPRWCARPRKPACSLQHRRARTLTETVLRDPGATKRLSFITSGWRATLALQATVH